MEASNLGVLATSLYSDRGWFLGPHIMASERISWVPVLNTLIDRLLTGNWTSDGGGGGVIYIRNLGKQKKIHRDTINKLSYVRGGGEILEFFISCTAAILYDDTPAAIQTAISHLVSSEAIVSSSLTTLSHQGQELKIGILHSLIRVTSKRWNKSIYYLEGSRCIDIFLVFQEASFFSPH